ncbi:MAG: hypothetical protein K2X35_10345, partial [Bryobacteraceae bacterium]|nr:hypothetical protein [Bryobacteraceae bacterium]
KAGSECFGGGEFWTGTVRNFQPVLTVCTIPPNIPKKTNHLRRSGILRPQSPERHDASRGGAFLVSDGLFLARPFLRPESAPPNRFHRPETYES